MKIEIMRLEKIHHVLNLRIFFCFSMFIGKFCWPSRINCVRQEPDVRITTPALFQYIIHKINYTFKIILNGGLSARVELRISFQNRDIFHFRSWLWAFRVWNVSTYFAGYFLNENVAQSNYITYITAFLNPYIQVFSEITMTTYFCVYYETV